MLNVGIINENQNFIPVMMALSNKEDSETFEYIFKFINSKCDHSPTNCIGDGGKAARIAAKNIWPETTLLMCWWHMSNAVKRKLRWLDARDTTVFNDLMDDLYFIQTYALDEESFNVLYGLFLRKYTEEYQFFDKELKQDVCQNAIPYISKVWAHDETLRNWYQGANPQVI